MSMKNTAIGFGIGFVIWRLFGGILSFIFLIFLLVLLFDIEPDPDPAPTFSERQAAQKVEHSEDLAKPNRLIISFKKAIADRNIPEIDRLYRGVVRGIENTGRYHIVARDVDIMLGILKTCPVEIRNEQWGIDQMNHSRSRAQTLMAERELYENKKELYRLKKEIRNMGG